MVLCFQVWLGLRQKELGDDPCYNSPQGAVFVIGLVSKILKVGIYFLQMSMRLQEGFLWPNLALSALV